MTYNGFMAGPVFGAFFGTEGVGVGMGSGGELENHGFVQVGIDYGLAWAGPRTTRGIGEGDLAGKLNAFEITAGIAGF